MPFTASSKATIACKQALSHVLHERIPPLLCFCEISCGLVAGALEQQQKQNREPDFEI
jgi:hypothetical protein